MLLTNVFRLDGLGDVRWWRFAAPAAPAAATGAAVGDSAADVAVLEAHLRLQEQGHTATWALAAPGGAAVLWLFLHRCSPCHDTSDLSLTLLLGHLAVHEEGVWNPGDAGEEVTDALLRALQHRAERGLRVFSYLRFGTSFIKCASATRAPLLACNLSFIVNRGSVCVKAAISRRRLRQLSAADTQEAARSSEADSRQQQVLVSPFGRQAALLGTCQADLVAELRRRLDNGQADTPLPTSQASHVEVLMNLPQEGNSSGRDTNSITNTDNSEGLRMVVSKDAVLLGSCSFWPRESREEGPAGKSSTDSSSTSSLGPEVDSDPGEEVVPAATARTPIMVEDKVMREPEESKPLGPAKRPRSSRGATQASLSAAASQASHMALTAAPSQQVSSGKPIDADMEDPEQDDEDAPLAKLLQMPSQAQPMKLSSFEMSLTTTPWDWEGDADTSGATNDADLLADFGDFGDFFEDDTLGLGEPPALMKEGEDRGHTMTPAPRRWPASALRIILRDSKLAELLNSRLEEKQRVQAVAWSDHLKQLQQSVESAAARQAVLAEAAVLQSSLAMPQGAMLPMRSSSLSSQSAASYAPSQSGKEIRAELLEHSYSYSAEPPRTPALPEPQLARPSCDQAYKQEEDEGGAEEADAGGTLHWPPPEAVLQIARKARIIVATELANLQVELHLLRCKAEQASALHKLGVSSLSRPAKGWVGQDRALHALAQQFLAPFDAALECGQGDLCRQDVESGGSLLWLLAEASPATVLYILREEVGPALVLAFGRVQGPLNASEWCLGKSMQLSSVTADTEEPAAAFGRGPESEPITPPHWHHSSPGPPHHTPLHLDTPSPLPGTPDEPGLPRQRLPQRSHHAKAPSMAVLPVPAVFVGYQDDWLKTSPAVLELWEKVPLEPFAPPKPVNYIVLCPQVEPHQECTIHFIRQLTTVYESSRLGSHVPAFSSLEASSKAPPGIIWVSSGSSSGNSEWRENFRLALQAARLAVKRLTDATTTHTDLDDDYCLVAYIVCPSDPLVAAGFVAECTELLPQATVQLLPFDALMKGAQGSSPGLPLPPSDLRELALAVYVKAVRLHQALAEEPQGPGGGKVQMLVNGGSASLPGQARFDETYEPLFILAEPGRYETVVNELEGKIAREGEGSDGGHEVEETRTVSSSEDSTNAGIGGWPSLHCCYAWVESEQEQCLVYAWTDSRGELLSIRVVRQLASMSPWTKSAFSNLLAHGLRIHELLMRGGQGGRGSAPLVIARLGSMSSGEMQDWETTISEKLRGLVCTSSVTAQPQANSDGLEEVGEDYQGGVTSVSLLSLEPSTDLQLVHTTESTATGTNDSSTPQGLRANTSAAATAMAVVKSLANQPASYLFAPKGFTTFSTQVQAEAYVVSALPACKKAEWPSTLHFTLVLQYEKRAQTSAGMASHASRHWLPLIAAELHGLSWLSWRRHTVLPIHVSAVYRFCHLLKVLNNAKVSLPLTSGMEASS